MDETSPVFENFRNKMQAFGQPIRGTTRRVSASKFLGRENIGEQVEINSRKITILKNIIQAQQIQTGVMLASLSTDAKGIDESIMDIRETMISILETLKAQEDFEMKKFLDMQRREEDARRGKRETLLEKTRKKGFSILKKGVNKVIAPVQNIFSRLISSFVSLIGGKLLISFLGFFANPRNAAIVDGISNFVTNFFPVIIAGVVAATIGIAALAIKMVGITKALRLAALTLGFGSPVASLLGIGLEEGIGRGVGGGFKDKMKLPKMPKFSGDMLMKRVPRMRIPRIKFNMGGLVPGRGNSDTVPAMLTPGEVVISKPAVQKFGLGNLLSLNRAAGSSSKPKIRNGISYANEGMVATDIMGLFNNLINTANEIPETELGKKIMTTTNQLPETEFGEKMMGFEETMRDAAVDIGNKVTKEDLGQILNLKNTVPNFLLGGGPKPKPPTELLNKVKDVSQQLLPVMTQTFGGDDSPFGDIQDVISKFSNPDLSPETFDNELNQVSLLEPSVDKLSTLGLFA